MSRPWISESELHAIRSALEGPWRRPLPEAEVRGALSWFSDPQLVDWFVRAADQPVVLDPKEFSIAMGEQAALQVVHFKPTLVLDEAARHELVVALDALRAPELTWLEVTFDFKPLRG